MFFLFCFNSVISFSEKTKLVIRPVKEGSHDLVPLDFSIEYGICYLYTQKKEDILVKEKDFMTKFIKSILHFFSFLFSNFKKIF